MFANNALLGGGVRVRVWIREQRKIKRRSEALLCLWWQTCLPFFVICVGVDYMLWTRISLTNWFASVAQLLVGWSLLCLGHSSDSSSQGGGSGGSDEEEGEGRRKRREEEREEGRSTGSLHSAGGEGEAGSPAAEGGNKAPKPKTPQQQVKHQCFATFFFL